MIAEPYRMFTALFWGIAMASAAAQAVEKIETEFITVSLHQGAKDLFYHDGTAPRPFPSNTMEASNPHPYHGPQQLVLFANPEEFDAKPAPEPVASVLLPAKAARVLLACLKSADHPLRIIAYDISTNTQSGDYRFFNFSKQEVALTFEGHKQSLGQEKDASFSDPRWCKDVLDLKIEISTSGEGTPKIAYSSVWGHRPGRVNLIFLLDGNHPSRPIQILRFFDIPGAQAELSAP